jgi:hypothetical protein
MHEAFLHAFIPLISCLVQMQDSLHSDCLTAFLISSPFSQGTRHFQGSHETFCSQIPLNFSIKKPPVWEVYFSALVNDYAENPPLKEVRRLTNIIILFFIFLNYLNNQILSCQCYPTCVATVRSLFKVNDVPCFLAIAPYSLDFFLLCMV